MAGRDNFLWADEGNRRSGLMLESLRRTADAKQIV